MMKEHAVDISVVAMNCAHVSRKLSAKFHAMAIRTVAFIAQNKIACPIPLRDGIPAMF